MQRVRYKDIERIPKLKINTTFKQAFSGAIPAPFIGRHNYPNINIGLLSPQHLNDPQSYDQPKEWSKQLTPIGDIASKRYQLVNTRTKQDVHNISNPTRFLSLCQEAGMAKKAIECDVLLKKQPKISLYPEKEILPFGPGAQVDRAQLTSNTKVNLHVEKVYGDTDLKAKDAILHLNKKHIDEYQLTKVLSVGAIGVQKNRKLVPTRWSITATDDMLAKATINHIKQFPTKDYTLQFGGAWGNYYLLLFFPEVWSYELFETYIHYKKNPWSKAGTFYSTDYEPYQGRKTYAQETAGGFYSARLPITQHLQQERKQASVLALRFITPAYKIPLGVFVCREATRKALQSKELTFSTKEEMLTYAQELINNQLGFNISSLLKESKLLTSFTNQSKLTQFL